MQEICTVITDNLHERTKENNLNKTFCPKQEICFMHDTWE